MECYLSEGFGEKLAFRGCQSAPTKASARNISDTPRLAGSKRTISILVDQNPYVAG